MNWIAISVERAEPQRAQQMYESGVAAPVEPKKSTIMVYGLDHRAEEAKGKARNLRMEQEGQ